MACPRVAQEEVLGFRMMHGGISAPSCCDFTHRVAFEEAQRVHPRWCGAGRVHPEATPGPAVDRSSLHSMAPPCQGTGSGSLGAGLHVPGNQEPTTHAPTATRVVGLTEDEMAGWHHRPDGPEFE